MDQKKIKNKPGFTRIDQLLVSVFSILILIVVGITFFEYYTPEWKSYQDEFREIVEEKFGKDLANNVPSGIQQIYLKELNRADRCVTCHLATEWKGFENERNPFKTHPKKILDKHPITKYGCTICHGGQGYAVDFDNSHGLVQFWEEPILGKELSDFYDISNKKALMEMRCNSCHRFERETEGADYINRAKKLVNEKGCRVCHVINGRGGSVGPDLTYAGEKSAEQFNYERIKGLHTVFSWHVAHFKNPKELVPETVMPNFNFSSVDAQALAILMMSWKKNDIPINYIPANGFRDIPTSEELEKEKNMMSGPGSFFVKKNCFVCHSVSTLGIEAAAQIGPDLALAVEDVQSRFGQTLDDFLGNPTGTMGVVLSTMINLSEDEKKEAIAKLREAYEIKKKEREKNK